MRNQQPLSLHIPVPHARPGETPDFSYLTFPEAGATRRPDSLTPEAQMRDLPYSLIRVLAEDGRAVGPWDQHLSPDILHRALRAMLLTRLFDDRMFTAHHQGKTSFYMKSTGEEATAVAPSLALLPGDMCFPTYRMVGFLMARDYKLANLVNQIFANAGDPMRGRQLPLLYSAREYGFYTLAGNVGSRFGHAVGWAMASAYRHDDRIAMAFVGDGTTAEGSFHEAMVFASVYHAPAILCVTNNQWAISSYQGMAGGEETTFAARGIGYGLPGLRVDGNDVLAVYAATLWAAERARANHGATLIEFVTYRVAGHSSNDDPSRYRPSDEAGAWPLGDPIERLKAHLIAIGEWSEVLHEALATELREQVRAAAKAGEALGTHGQNPPPKHEMFDHVFKEPDWRNLEQRRESGADS